MTKTKMRLVEHSSTNVTLSYFDEDEGRVVHREFWTPDRGGYVREVTETRPGTLGLQVCEKLYHTGHALYLGKDQRLATLIRREYRARKREEVKIR